jgi:hypothetical protein
MNEILSMYWMYGCMGLFVVTLILYVFSSLGDGPLARVMKSRLGQLSPFVFLEASFVGAITIAHGWLDGLQAFLLVNGFLAALLIIVLLVSWGIVGRLPWEAERRE